MKLEITPWLPERLADPPTTIEAIEIGVTERPYAVSQWVLELTKFAQVHGRLPRLEVINESNQS